MHSTVIPHHTINIGDSSQYNSKQFHSTPASVQFNQYLSKTKTEDHNLNKGKFNEKLILQLFKYCMYWLIRAHGMAEGQGMTFDLCPVFQAAMC